MLKELLLLWNLISPVNAQELDKKLDVLYLGKTIGVAELRETKKNSELKTSGYVKLNFPYKYIYPMDVALDVVESKNKVVLYVENIYHSNYWAVHSFDWYNKKMYISTNEKDPLNQYKIKSLLPDVLTPISAYKDIVKRLSEKNFPDKINYILIANTTIDTIPCLFKKSSNKIRVSADFSKNKELAKGIGGVEKIVLCFSYGAELDTIEAYSTTIPITHKIIGIPAKE